MMNGITLILIYAFTLFILYIVIETAVRKGSNHSIIDQALENKLGITEEKKKAFFDNDLDDDK